MAPAKKKKFLKASALMAAAFLFVVSAGCSDDNENANDLSPGNPGSESTTTAPTTTVPEQNIGLSGDCYLAYVEAEKIYADLAGRGVAVDQTTLIETSNVAAANRIVETLRTGCIEGEQLVGGITQTIVNGTKTANNRDLGGTGFSFVPLAIVCNVFQKSFPEFPESLKTGCTEANIKATDFLLANGITDIKSEAESGLIIPQPITDFLPADPTQ